jgi:hypothetical protein
VEAHVVPGKRETWAPHTVSGYYIGNAMQHYRCHDIYIPDTKGTRTCETVFFKHKYLTMPTLTTADALIQAADSLTAAIDRTSPQPGMTRDAIDQLISIFKAQAEKEKDAVTAQRVAKERAQAERVRNEKAAVPTPEQEMRFEVDKYPEIDIGNMSRIGVITQDDDNAQATPAANTRQQHRARTITQECAYSMIDLPIAGPVPVNTMAPQKCTTKQASARQYPLAFMCEWVQAVLDNETGDLLEYRQLIKNPKYKEVWSKSFAKEIRRLADTTKTIAFVSKQQIPQGRRKDITYGRICCDYRSEKADPNRTRITVGGDRITYPGDCGTPTADLLTVKILLNSIVSTMGAKFMTIDIKDFYLMTPMDRPEYFRMKLELFPQEIIEQYGLEEKADEKGTVFCEVNRGMYGLPHAGKLAQDQLSKRLNEVGYYQSKTTPGYWKHEWRPISFTLVVDDFGVKYVNKTDVEHLLGVLKEHYEIDTDWDGTRYLGLTLDWDYENECVHLSMPEYIEKTMVRFGHKPPLKPQMQPHPHTKPVYGAKVQYAKLTDDSEPATKDEEKFIRQVIGTLLYYGRAVDSTLLVALSALASAQSKATKYTLELVTWLLDYVATNPNAILTYKKRDMILAVHSDASYLSESEARSRVGGHFYCTNDMEDPPNNGAVLNVSKILDTVMSSAAEAELGALYVNAREAVPMRHLLEEMGHKQPKTPIQTDNSTACGVVNSTIQPRRTKALDMRFYWLRCRDEQGQFRYYWRPGTENLADYWTKHHCAAHHIEKRPTILTPKIVLDALRASTKRTPATTGKGLAKITEEITRTAVAA